MLSIPYGRRHKIILIPPTPFSPTDITGCQLYLKADVGITKDIDGYVSQWNDQSGYVNNATQGIGVSQPLYVDNYINEKPIIRFDGSNDFMSFSNIILSDSSIFIVAKQPNVDFGRILDGGPSYEDDDLMFRYDGNRLYWESYSTNSKYIRVDNPIDENFNYISLIQSSSTSNVYYNGVNQILNVNTQPINPRYSRIGWYGNTYWFAGDIAEIIIYNTALNSTDRLKVETYIQNKYFPIGTNIKLWLKADVGITKDENDYVSVWSDQSGNGNDATQSIGSSQPLWIDNYINNKPSVYFSSDWMQGTIISNIHNSSFTLFIIVDYQNPTGVYPTIFSINGQTNGFWVSQYNEVSTITIINNNVGFWGNKFCTQNQFNTLVVKKILNTSIDCYTNGNNNDSFTYFMPGDASVGFTNVAYKLFDFSQVDQTPPNAWFQK